MLVNVKYATWESGWFVAFADFPGVNFPTVAGWLQGRDKQNWLLQTGTSHLQHIPAPTVQNLNPG